MEFWLNRFSANRDKKFSKVYSKNLFFGAESRSGRGSDSDQTRVLKLALPPLLKSLGVSTILDVPCGDLNWMKGVDLLGIRYTGADIVSDLVENLNTQYSGSGKHFVVLDVVRQELPQAFDAIFCRDLLVHLSTDEIIEVLRKFKASGSKYLLTTHFTEPRKYKSLPLFSRGVGWRPINFTLKPFSFPKPQILVNEECAEANGAFKDKSVAVWLLEAIQI
jgi:2-polyprenyl-3-methyl-5-hydroxy-6-metoxy-1,4-benzoquinol methylase